MLDDHEYDACSESSARVESTKSWGNGSSSMFAPMTAMSCKIHVLVEVTAARIW